MFLRTFQFSRIISSELLTASDWAFGTHISKRYAGHSQYANRKSAKEASAERRSQLIKKYQFEINKEIRQSKNANLATNGKLQSILGEAMKNNVPKASLENTIKAAAAILGRDCIHSFMCINNSFGIMSVIELSSIHRERVKGLTSGIIKKFGFQFVHNGEVTIQNIGIITCKPLENVKNSLDKALENAIVANCEEVREVKDNLLEFQCHPQHIDSCTKQLTELGYEVEISETRYLFPEFVKIDEDVIFEKLDKMEDKLQTLPEFVKISYNIE